MRIDLNSDLGETVDGLPTADDATMFALVTSANLACGFHAGDAASMRQSTRLAAEHGVSLGAHVSYDDRAGFGRRDVDVGADELRAQVLAQLSALAEAARGAGTRIRYVKPHGALYNRIVHDRVHAAAVAAAVAEFDRALPLLGLAGSEIHRAAAAHGLGFVGEAFVDRAYRSDGTLVPRSEPGAVLVDPRAAADRAVGMVRSGAVTATDGTVIPVDVRSLCVHGDTRGAVAMAREVRSALVAAGVTVEPFA